MTEPPAAATPGSGAALPQTPLVSVATEVIAAFALEVSLPATTQSPGAAHEISGRKLAADEGLNPVTSWAVPQVPSLSPSTNSELLST